jgi:hypothetical protein
MKKRSRHVDLGPDPDAADYTQAPAATGRIMREKTKIREDGTIYQERSMLKVAASDEVPELPAARRIQIHDEPVYDTFSAGDDADGDSDSEVPAHRDMRDSVCNFGFFFSRSY